MGTISAQPSNAPITHRRPPQTVALALMTGGVAVPGSASGPTVGAAVSGEAVAGRADRGGLGPT